MLAPEDHEHEIGEDITRCANCVLTKLEEAMSDFETAIWNWYWTNVSPFAMAGGLMPMLITDTGIIGRARTWFIRGLSLIRNTFDRIADEKNKATE